MEAKKEKILDILPNLQIQALKFSLSAEYMHALKRTRHDVVLCMWMEALKERADALEESGLKWIERSEAAKEQLPEVEEALEAAEKVAVEAREKLDARTAELKRIHDEAAQLQAPLLEQIPNNVLSYYKRLRGRGKPPFVAVLRRGACGGCGFTHPAQRHQEIKQGKKLIPCEQCGRIQVWKVEEDEQVGF